MNKRKVRGARRRGLRSSISWTLKKRQMRSLQASKEGKRKHGTDHGNTSQDPEKQVCRYRFASGCKESRKAHARNAGALRMENYQERTGTSARV